MKCRKQINIRLGLLLSPTIYTHCGVQTYLTSATRTSIREVWSHDCPVDGRSDLYNVTRVCQVRLSARSYEDCEECHNYVGWQNETKYAVLKSARVISQRGQMLQLISDARLTSRILGAFGNNVTLELVCCKEGEPTSTRRLELEPESDWCWFTEEFLQGSNSWCCLLFHCSSI